VSQNLFFVDLTEKKVTHYLEKEHYQFQPDLIKKAENIYDVLCELGDNTNNIVYCSSKFEAIDKAEKMFSQIRLQENTKSANLRRVIRQIKGYIHKDYYLADFLNKGIAYHFGNLPQIIRNKVEALFKDREIGYVFCTS